MRRGFREFLRRVVFTGFHRWFFPSAARDSPEAGRYLAIGKPSKIARQKSIGCSGSSEPGTRAELSSFLNRSDNGLRRPLHRDSDYTSLQGHLLIVDRYT
jgi:hypothetical protein